MARICTEVTEWIEEKVSRPVEEWEERQEKKCKKRKLYDPRKWLRAGEQSMVERLKRAFTELNCIDRY